MTDLTRTRGILDRLVAFPTISCGSTLVLINWVRDLLQHASRARHMIAAAIGLYSRK